jgi:hypothetical protein
VGKEKGWEGLTRWVGEAVSIPGARKRFSARCHV